MTPDPSSAALWCTCIWCDCELADADDTDDPVPEFNDKEEGGETKCNEPSS